MTEGHFCHTAKNIVVTLSHWQYDNEASYTLEIVDLENPDSNFFMVASDSLSDILAIVPLNVVNMQYHAHSA
jgi:hypothetical protein